MPKPNLLSDIRDADLIRELARRLEKNSRRTDIPSAEGVNAARLQMIRALQSPSPHGQPLEILRFLVQSVTPQTMSAITDHMRTVGYRASRYYDASNALTDMQFAAVNYRAGEKVWVATEVGIKYLATHKGKSQ